MLIFEYDPAKSASNKDKHGIDFDLAQELWAVPGYVVASRVPDEDRFLRTAPLEGKFWTAVYTRRDGAIRIISVRRARASEERGYEHQDTTDQH